MQPVTPPCDMKSPDRPDGAYIKLIGSFVREMSEFNRYGDIEFKIAQTLYFPKHYPLLFVSNAKVACTTIKKSIWISSSPETFQENSNPHDKVSGPFENNLYTVKKNVESVASLTKFGISRNPYTRFLSAYRDKIERPKRDAHVWKILCERYGFDKGSRPSMDYVLECVLDDNPLQVDQHFALQKNNLSLGLIDYDFIGNLENFDEIQRFLGDFGIGISSHLKHSTGSGKLEGVSDFLGQKTIDLIQKVYSEDFANFGYSLDPTKTAPVSSATIHSVNESILKNLIDLATTRDPNERASIQGKISELMEIPPNNAA